MKRKGEQTRIVEIKTLILEKFLISTSITAPAANCTSQLEMGKETMEALEVQDRLMGQILEWSLMTTGVQRQPGDHEEGSNMDDNLDEKQEQGTFGAKGIVRKKAGLSDDEDDDRAAFKERDEEEQLHVAQQGESEKEGESERHPLHRMESLKPIAILKVGGHKSEAHE
jgi:hypothetical protein